MTPFLQGWGEAALTTLSFFWIAFWAFGLGYLISALIQTFVSRARMTRAMGGQGPRAMALGTLFGFVSSSCSFAALATTRALFAKGAGFVPALAFLLASTNLVIELGIVISVFLSWHFVVGEYVGGLLLILFTWGIVRAFRPGSLIDSTRERLEAGEDDDAESLSDVTSEPRVWGKIARAYMMEWQMVWKDVTVGFTLAGVVAAFVPPAFFTWLFPGTGAEDPSFLQVLGQAAIGPVAAFFTFIGSMGNIPLAGLLYANGVGVAGVMAFIFSDLVVAPVLRVNAQFYGWKMALYIAGVFLVSLIVAALVLHYGFDLLGLSPEAPDQGLPPPESRFALDYTFWLNMAFLALSGAFFLMSRTLPGHPSGHDHGKGGVLDTVLTWLALASYAWLAIGLALRAVG
jgi:uncharacterized membrane protein YraQ (UPF0718 family)